MVDFVEHKKLNFVYLSGSCVRSELTSPSTKNPVIARFFREIGRTDELGSGVRRLMKYGKAYGGSAPEMIEGDVFSEKIVVSDLHN